MSLALRRHHAARIKRRVYSYVKLQNWRRPEDRDYVAQRMWQNPQRCSCSICGNPRRYGKGKERLTLQEQRVSQSENWSDVS